MNENGCHHMGIQFPPISFLYLLYFYLFIYLMYYIIVQPV